MKKLSLLLVMMMLIGFSFAQISNYYTFEQAAGTYTAITGTSITTILSDDAISGVIDIGFTFAYGMNTYTQVKVSSNGYVGLGSAVTSTLTNALASTTYCPVLAPLWDDTDLTGGNCQYLLTGTAPNRVFTIQWSGLQWNYSATNTHEYQVLLYETGKVEFIYGAEAGAPASASASIGINMLPGGATNYMSVTPGTPATVSTAAENTAISTWPGAGVVYRFNPPAGIPNDLAALSISGNTTPTAGAASQYTVTIRNMGTAAQPTYNVQLMSGTTVLATVAGPTIQPSTNADVTVTWTPAVAGAMSIFGKVVLATDGNANNNQTGPLVVNVQEPGTVAVTIGAGDLAFRAPMDFYWKNSLYECIYLASEINMGGLITSLAFYNNFTSTELAAGKPTKIWLGETTQTDLTGGWIPSTQLTSVFDGTVNYPSGVNTITITLTNPYAYSGSNLVLMVNRPMDTAYFDFTDYFACQTATAGRALALSDDTTTFDPANPEATTAITSYPKATLFFITDDLGAISGTVSSGGQPLADATVSVAGTFLTAQTSATGQYSFPYVAIGAHQVTCSKLAYVTQTLNVTVLENQTATLNFIMVASPTVTVTGTVVGSDAPTVGLVGASVALDGAMDYTATTNAAGQFTMTGVLGSATYAYTIMKAGYSPATGTINVGTTAFPMGTITLNEMAYPATQVVAVEAAPNVNVTWAAPDPNAVNITESFESETYPPTDWTQTTTSTDPLNTYGIGGTWIRCGAVALTPAINPQDGSWQCGMWWSYNHQDEWLITPQFVCPGGASLSFKGYIFLGSTNDDHYYIKASTDGGTNWSVIWDAVAIGGGAYSDYTTPITIPLSAYAGQQIKLAWHADDPNSTSDGMWNVAFFDQVVIGSPTRTITFSPEEMEIRSAGPQPSFHITKSGTGLDLPSKAMALGLETKAPAITTNSGNDRALLGYKVWRLNEGQEANEGSWTQLTANTITATAYQDMTWGAATDGTYKWAVKAIYTGNVLSVPAFSNAIVKLTQIGTIAGNVHQVNLTPIAGATITVGTYTATSNATGAYSVMVPAGTHTVVCTAPGYQAAQQTGVVVVTGVTTAVNFTLQVSSEVTDGFETYGDFSIDFAPWINVDVDASGTYGYSGYTWANEYLAQSFMVFNPGLTTPSSIAVIGAAHGGNKMAMCWAATAPPNNDWLITQQYACGGTFSFWAKSMSADYPAEQFFVGVSTGGTAPANFTVVSGAVTTTTTSWQQYTYPLTAYVGQNIRVGIHCVSNDQFALCVDDVIMTLNTGIVDPSTPVVSTVLNGNYPNPFNPETTISYSVKGSSPVVIEVYNLKGQKVKTLVNETKSASGNFEVKWNGTDENNQRVSSGVYFYKMNAGRYSSTRKMIMMQ